MKNLTLSLALVLISGHTRAQDALKQAPTKLQRIYINYYASDLLTGDIALGLEHLYTKKLSQELSFGIRSFATKPYDYNKGYRVDYLFKYNIYSGKNFRFSSNLSLTYKDLNYSSKPVGYYYLDSSGATHPQPTAVFLENGRLREFGFGLGISLNFRLSKRLFVGTDLTFNAVRYELSQFERELLVNEVQDLHDGNKNNSGTRIVPYGRIKISYLLTRR